MRAKRRCAKDCKNYQPCSLHPRGWKNVNPATALPSNWQSVARATKARANGRCQLCGVITCVSCTAQIRCGADHRVSRADGGSHGLDNTQWVCHSCHKLKTESDNRNRRKKKKE